MKYLRLTLATVGVLLMVGCGTDPHSFRITEKNKDSFLKDMKDMKGLTVEEVGLLMAAQMQNGVGKAFGGSERKIVDRTVGELLNELKKEAVEKEKEDARQEKLAAEARAQEEARMAELRKAVALTVVSKGFQAADFQDFVTIKVAYENTSEKDIRAFTGKIQFTDLFGKELFESGVTISDPVRAGAKGIWDGSIRYNQFIEPHKALRSADLKDLKIVWKPSSILFADGSRIGEAAE